MPINTPAATGQLPDATQVSPPNLRRRSPLVAADPAATARAAGTGGAPGLIVDTAI
jgi:hypothetical protein